MKLKHAYLIAAGSLLTLMVAALAVSERRMASRICYENGYERCLPRNQVPLDTTLLQTHILDGDALVVFGFPLSWRIRVERVGKGVRALEEVRTFHWFRRHRASSVFGSLETRISVERGTLSLVTYLENPDRKIRLLLGEELPLAQANP